MGLSVPIERGGGMDEAYSFDTRKRGGSAPADDFSCRMPPAQDTLQLYEMEGEEGLPGVGERRDIGVRPGKESGADAADTVPLAAEGMISCGEGANVPEAGRILPRSGAVMSDMEALELLVAESVERVKLSAARSYNAPHITDLIVRTVMDVVKVVLPP
jgi:hypothetical protein